MNRIKVTGYIEVDDLPFEYVDSSHEMGLSNTGYEKMQGAAQFATQDGELIGIAEVEFEKEED